MSYHGKNFAPQVAYLHPTRRRQQESSKEKPGRGHHLVSRYTGEIQYGYSNSTGRDNGLTRRETVLEFHYGTRQKCKKCRQHGTKWHLNIPL